MHHNDFGHRHGQRIYSTNWAFDVQYISFVRRRTAEYAEATQLSNAAKLTCIDYFNVLTRHATD